MRREVTQFLWIYWNLKTKQTRAWNKSKIKKNTFSLLGSGRPITRCCYRSKDFPFGSFCDFISPKTQSYHHLLVTHLLSYTFLFVLSAGGPVPRVGVTITMDDEMLNGTNRVVLDGVMTEKECDRILQLASVSSISFFNACMWKPLTYTFTWSLIGGRISWRWLSRTAVSTHSSWDVWRSDCPQGGEGGWKWCNWSRSTSISWPSLLFLPQLAQEGLVNQSDAKLLHELGERVRTVLHSYFRSPSGLFITFTHLVCRTAVTGKTNSTQY